jgi:hypothetical protein
MGCGASAGTSWPVAGTRGAPESDIAAYARDVRGTEKDPLSPTDHTLLDRWGSAAWPFQK